MPNHFEEIADLRVRGVRGVSSSAGERGNKLLCLTCVASYIEPSIDLYLTVENLCRPFRHPSFEKAELAARRTHDEASESAIDI